MARPSKKMKVKNTVSHLPEKDAFIKYSRHYKLEIKFSLSCLAEWIKVPEFHILESGQISNSVYASAWSVAQSRHRHTRKKVIRVNVYLSLCRSSSLSDSLSESSCFLIFFSFCFGVLFLPSGVSFSFFSAFSGVSSISLFSLLLSFNLSCVLSSSLSFLAGVASRASLLRP